MQLFTTAVEEAKELLDRREGREVATTHDPLDFLVARPEYDLTLIEMMAKREVPFQDIFPPLSQEEAVTIDAGAALAAVRARARAPRPPEDTVTLSMTERSAERLVIWCRFALAPVSAQAAMKRRRGARCRTRRARAPHRAARRALKRY
jgi:hypothetical protein